VVKTIKNKTMIEGENTSCEGENTSCELTKDELIEICRPIAKMNSIIDSAFNNEELNTLAEILRKSNMQATIVFKGNQTTTSGSKFLTMRTHMLDPDDLIIGDDKGNRVKTMDLSKSDNYGSSLLHLVKWQLGHKKKK